MSENIKDDINVVNEDYSSASNEVKRVNLYKLVETYNKRSSIKMKEEFLKSQIKVVPYLGYGTKMFLANNIVERCCLNETGTSVHMDSCKKYILYVYTLLKYWTNLDIQENDLLIQYDLLDQNDMVEKILMLIPEKEVSTFGTILDMKVSDYLTNNCNTQAFINNKLNEFYPEFSKVVMPIVEKLNDKLNILDESKIEKILKNVVKIVS